MKKLILMAVTLFMGMVGNFAFADACNTAICICPGGTQINFGQYCPAQAPTHATFITRMPWSYFSNSQPRDAQTIASETKSLGYCFTEKGNIYYCPSDPFGAMGNKKRRKTADEVAKNGQMYNFKNQRLLYLQAEYLEAKAGRSSSSNANNGTTSGSAKAKSPLVESKPGWIYVGEYDNNGEVAGTVFINLSSFNKVAGKPNAFTATTSIELLPYQAKNNEPMASSSVAENTVFCNEQKIARHSMKVYDQSNGKGKLISSDAVERSATIKAGGKPKYLVLIYDLVCSSKSLTRSMPGWAYIGMSDDGIGGLMGTFFINESSIKKIGGKSDAVTFTTSLEALPYGKDPVLSFIAENTISCKDKTLTIHSTKGYSQSAGKGKLTFTDDAEVTSTQLKLDGGLDTLLYKFVCSPK